LSQHRPTSFVDARFDAPSIGESSSSPVVLFAATRWELAAIRRAMPDARRIEIDGVSGFTGRQGGRSYRLVLSGIGPDAAAATANAVLRREAALAVSAGFAAALLSTAAVGEMVVATSVLAGRFEGRWTQAGTPMACDDAVIRAVQAAAAQVGAIARSGPMVSLPTVLCRAADKQQVSQSAGAIALDMESAAIGNVARMHGVPFAVMRTVSDAVHEDLPLDFNAFLKPWGWARGISAMLLAPSSLRGLNRLRRHSRLAAGTLTAVTAVWAENGFGLSPASHLGKA
jgi:adenosylhomocysteine nucleosidase